MDSNITFISTFASDELNSRHFFFKFHRPNGWMDVANANGTLLNPAALVDAWWEVVGGIFMTGICLPRRNII